MGSFFLNVRFRMNGSHLILLSLLTLSANQMPAQNCTGRCSCLKPNSTLKPCPPPPVKQLSIQLSPQDIAISCRNSNQQNLNDAANIPSFNASFLTSINDTSPLTLATMIGRCSKAKTRNVVYALDANKFNSLSASQGVLHDNQLTYFKIENLGDKNVTLLETGFLNYGSQLSTLIVNKLKVRSLESYLLNLSHVETLDLADNDIEILGNSTWKNLTSLKHLSLRRNKLVVLDRLPNVTYLDLSLNNLKVLNKRAFESAHNLMYLNLSGNNLESIQNGTFQTLMHLKNLDLSQNDNLSFEARVFSNLTSLLSLNLSRCHVTHIPTHFLHQSKQLSWLNLSGNSIESLEKDSLVNLTNLHILDLSYNFITSLSEELLRPLENLKQIFLQSNLVTIFDSSVFSGRRFIETINLADNFVKMMVVKDKCNVTNISLRNNSIESLPSVFLQNLGNLKYLDLSHNLLTDFILEEAIPKAMYVEIDVTNNRIKNLTVRNVFISNDTNEVNNKSWKIMLDMSNNRLKCDCLRYGTVTLPETETVTTIMQLTREETVCYRKFPYDNCPMIQIKNCPKECECFYTRLNNAINVNCSSRRLEFFPEINGLQTTLYNHNQTIVLLNDNRLNLLGQENIKMYSNVSLLDLSRNRIEDLKWIPGNLTHLLLDDNRLTSLSAPVVKNLTDDPVLKRISMKGNPWKCDCSALPLQNFLILNNNFKVRQADVKCQENGDLLIYAKICEKKPNILKLALPLTFAILLALISVLAALYYKFNTSIKVYLYSKNWCLWCVAEEELDKDKTYDVFISFSHKDEAFVQTELVPELESGETPFKVCIHYRDWLPGEFISNQIINSVLDSRRTLVVLSNNFMESVWGKMEFRTAHLQAINEGRARVIVVLYGELDQEALDDEMKTYLKTNTYVEWGDPWFWNKLKYALPHSKGGRRYVTQESQESFHLR